MALIIDAETIPHSREEIEKFMPEELRSPVMPEEIANPAPFDDSKCPDYGATAAQAAFDKLDVTEDKKPGVVNSPKWITAKEKLAGLIEKKAAWKTEKLAAHEAKSNAAKAKWQADIDGRREKFFRDAALEARTASVKLLVLRDTMENEAHIFLVEVGADKIKALTAETFAYKAGAFSTSCELHVFASEAAMIRAFLSELARRYEAEKALDDRSAIVGYYIREFDFPFIYRRAWMNGIAGLPFFMNGRNYSNDVADLHEIFAFYHREYRVGGLDGLCGALGMGASKLGDGAGFGEWYERNPVEGVQYCVNDVQMTEGAGRIMGVVK